MDAAAVAAMVAVVEGVDAAAVVAAAMAVAEDADAAAVAAMAVAVAGDAPAAVTRHRRLPKLDKPDGTTSRPVFYLAT